MYHLFTIFYPLQVYANKKTFVFSSHPAKQKRREWGKNSNTKFILLNVLLKRVIKHYCKEPISNKYKNKKLCDTNISVNKKIKKKIVFLLLRNIFYIATNKPQKVNYLDTYKYYKTQIVGLLKYHLCNIFDQTLVIM